MNMTDFAVQARDLGKCYQIYEKPVDRLRQAIWRGRKQFYREFWAIRDISLNIRKGETLGIIGSNGSGKSTLLQLICGILTPTEGELNVSGRISALLELGAGFSPEFTGRENVFMNAAIMGLTRAEISERYDEVVAFADIGHFIEQPVKTYSSGMYVRLAFAIAINVLPDILVVDEALAVGDARFQQKCLAKIKKFCRTGTAIFVSHDTSAVTELCSRVIWIASGKIKMDGPPKFVAEKYLQYMYEGDTGSDTADAEVPGMPKVSHDMSRFVSIDRRFRQFGDRRISVSGVRMQSQGSGNGVVYAGRACDIMVALDCHADIAHPIVGYLVKDRLGRDVMGDNTETLSYQLSPFRAGHHYVIKFSLDAWPNLLDGDYALSLGVGEGSMEEHVLCHFVHDALIFKNVPFRPPAGIFSPLDTRVILMKSEE